MASSRTSRVLATIAAVALLAAAVWYLLPSNDRPRRAAARSPSDDPSGTDRTGSLGPAAAAGSGSSAPRSGAVVDRALADRMRDRIRALLAEAGPGWETPAPSAPSASAFPTMPVLPFGDAGVQVDPKYIQKRVRDDLFPLARQCYAGALGRDPKLAGRIEIDFTIMGDPRVGGVVGEAAIGKGTTLDDREFQTCVRESMMSVSFDAPPEGGEVTVVYPIEFSPDDDEAGGGG
jgi:hypothetical protein